MFKQLMASFLAVCEMFFPSVSGTQPPVDATSLILSDTAIYADGELVTEDSSAVWVSNSMVVIKEPGTYYVTGGMSDGSIVVDLTAYAKEHGYESARACPEAVATLILDGVEIRNSAGPGLMISGAYECDQTLGEKDDMPSAIQDTTTAGINLLLPKGSVSSISGAYDTDGKQAALISDVSFNILGEESSKLTVQSGENGITTLGHLLVSGGELQIFSTEDGLTANTKDASIMIGDTNLSIYTQDGDGIYSSGYTMINDGQVFITAGEKNDGIRSTLGTVINGGIVAAAGDDNTLPDTGDQPALMLSAEHPLLDIAVMDEAGVPVYAFNMAYDENYAGMDINRTFRSLIFSTPYLNLGSRYTIWTGASLNKDGTWSHGILQEPGKYDVVDGYPLKYTKAQIGSGKTFASSYLASVYDMATILDKAGSLDEAADMSALDTQANLVAQLDAAANLEEAAKNAENQIKNVDKSTMMGKDLWAKMTQSMQLEKESSSADFVAWDYATGFSGVYGLERSFSTYDLPAQLDTDTKINLSSASFDTPAANLRPFYAGMCDAPAQLDAPAQAAVRPAGYDFSAQLLNARASMEVDGRTFFFDGSKSALYTNRNGLPVSGDTIVTDLPNRNAVRLWNEGKGHLQKVSVSKSGNGTEDTVAENAAVFSGSGSSLFMADSDLFTKALYAPAGWVEEDSELNLTHVSVWTNQPFSPGLVSAKNGWLESAFLALDTYGGGSPALYAKEGEIKIYSVDINTAGLQSPLVQGDGPVSLELANGKALQSPIAELSKSLEIKDSTLYTYDQSNSIPAGFVLRNDGNEKMQLSLSESTVTSENEKAVLFFVDHSKAQLKLNNTELTIKSDWLLRSIEGEVEILAENQTLTGTIFSDNSLVKLYLKNGSEWNGTVIGNMELYLDETSVWSVTGDTSVKKLEMQTGAKIIDSEGKPVTLKDASGNILRRGSSEYTVICSSSII